MLCIRLAILTLVALFSAGLVLADSLELIDGSVLEGVFKEGSDDVIMFETGDSYEGYPTSQIIAIYFSAGVATAEAMATSPAASTVTAPAGTRLVIRMVDSIDSKKHQAGHKFRGQLEGAIVVDGVTVAPRGAFLYGVVTQAKQSGRAVGSSSLAMEFTDIMVDDQLYPIATEGLAAQTGGEGKKTAGRTARGAAIGGIVGGSSGAKTGAKVGVTASILTGGESINVPAGTLLETALRVPLNL